MGIRPLNFRVVVEEIKTEWDVSGKVIKVNSEVDNELVKCKVVATHDKSLFEINDVVYFKRSNGKEYKDKYWFVFEDDIEAVENDN